MKTKTTRKAKLKSKPVKPDNRIYFTPDNKCTHSVVRYLREWNRLSRTAAKALGCRVVACDPGVHLMLHGASIGFILPVTAAKKIAALVQGHDDVAQRYRRMCDALQACAQRHKIGVVGQPVEAGVIRELDRLLAGRHSTARGY